MSMIAPAARVVQSEHVVRKYLRNSLCFMSLSDEHVLIGYSGRLCNVKMPIVLINVIEPTIYADAVDKSAACHISSLQMILM